MLHLHALYLDLTDFFDTTFFAVACIAFWSYSHLSELLIDSTFHPTLHLS